MLMLTDLAGREQAGQKADNWCVNVFGVAFQSFVLFTQCKGVPPYLLRLRVKVYPINCRAVEEATRSVGIVQAIQCNHEMYLI